MKTSFIFLMLLPLLGLTQKICSEAKLKEITDPSRPGVQSVLVDCSCTIPTGKTITKQLLFEGSASSNITIDGVGATINGDSDCILEIKSIHRCNDIRNKSCWERPENITIKNFKIIGSIRIWGMSKNGEGKQSIFNGENLMGKSSRMNGHTERVQGFAPTNIIFENVTITGTDRIPLYISPGVTRFQLLHSTIKGTSSSVAVYLDAESANNTFRYNVIETNTSRELVAIDGSSHNVFMNNRFSSLNHGGIYLYRNCGENGVSRHVLPLLTTG